jgi:hypothetical protein
MLVMSKAEELILAIFHERNGDRRGAEPGQTLPLETIREEMSVRGELDMELDEAIESLTRRELLSREGDSLALTQGGYDFLYSNRSGTDRAR